jgi:tRNA-splicing ligase RtcB
VGVQNYARLNRDLMIDAILEAARSAEVAAALHGRRPRGRVAGIECRKDTDVIDEASVDYKPIDAVMAAQKDLVEVVHTLHALRDDAALISMAVPCQNLIRATETRIQPRERKPRSFNEPSTLRLEVESIRICDISFNSASMRLLATPISCMTDRTADVTCLRKWIGTTPRCFGAAILMAAPYALKSLSSEIFKLKTAVPTEQCCPCSSQNLGPDGERFSRIVRPGIEEIIRVFFR